jgi:hypothetical protein
MKIYRTIILPAVYGCEINSVNRREEYSLSVFMSRELRRIFGPKREDIKGGWKILHSEECIIFTSH